MFDSAIQRAEALEITKKIDMVRKIGKFYATTTQSLLTPEKLLQYYDQIPATENSELKKPFVYC